MFKYFLFFTILFNGLSGFAHGADVSTMVFKQNEDNTWSLQVRSSLEAFRKEVKAYFYDCPYKTPEEFNEQVLEHFENTLKILINDNKEILLKNGNVKLGHEAVVFYNKIKLPKDINSIKIRGTMFKEIYRSQVKVLILKKSFKKTPFMLSRKNSFSIDLHVKDNQFQLWPGKLDS